MADSLEVLKRKTVQGHHILAMTGNMGPLTGHVFVRAPGGDQFLARCRHEGDWSPTWVGEDALHLMNFDGKPAEDLGDWTPPPERNIAMPIFKGRPDVGCVIHAHPYYQLLCGITGVPLRPILGPAYNAAGLQAALRGIPVYPRAALIASPELGRAVYATMGNNDVLILRGHGNVITGRTVEEAVLLAMAMEYQAQHCWQVALTGRTPSEISMIDIEEMLTPRQEGALESGEMNRTAVRPPGWNGSWEYHVRLLENGAKIPAEVLARNR